MKFALKYELSVVLHIIATSVDDDDRFPDLLGGGDALNLINVMTLKADEDHLTCFGIDFNLSVVSCVHLVSGYVGGDFFIAEFDDIPSLCIHLFDPGLVHHDPSIEFAFFE